jgi:L-rhamnose isomerase
MKTWVDGQLVLDEEHMTWRQYNNITINVRSSYPFPTLLVSHDNLSHSSCCLDVYTAALMRLVWCLTTGNAAEALLKTLLQKVCSETRSESEKGTQGNQIAGILPVHLLRWQ